MEDVEVNGNRSMKWVKWVKVLKNGILLAVKFMEDSV